MRAFVTLGTDGLRDYVELPDGVRYLLGTLSVTRLLGGLVSQFDMRRVCDAFNEGKRPRVSVDLDALQEVLELNIHRSRWAGATSPLIPAGNRTPKHGEGRNMAANETVKDEGRRALIATTLTAIEQHVAAVAAAKKASAEDCEKLRALTATLSTEPVEAPVAAEAAPAAQAAPPAPVDMPKAAGMKSASFENLETNTATIEQTLALVQATDTKIEKLVAAGKQFNHVAARRDLQKIASRVEDIVASVDLAYAWVNEDLSALAKQAEDIHNLFPADL